MNIVAAAAILFEAPRVEDSARAETGSGVQALRKSRMMENSSARSSLSPGGFRRCAISHNIL